MSSYHGWTHAPKEDGGTDPIPLPPLTASVEFPWVNLLDGAWDLATGIWKQVPFESYAKGYDAANTYFTLTKDATVGYLGSWKITVNQEGIYLVDCVVGFGQVGTGAPTYSEPQGGKVVIDLQPSLNSHVENVMTGGVSEKFSFRATGWWIDLIDFEALRVHTIASIRAGTSFAPRAKQATGVTRDMGGRYFKIVYLEGHSPTGEWTTGVV
jgi:hypothetical protein